MSLVLEKCEVLIYKQLQMRTNDNKLLVKRHLTITQVYPNSQATFGGFLIFSVHILSGFP